MRLFNITDRRGWHPNGILNSPLATSKLRLQQGHLPALRVPVPAVVIAGIPRRHSVLHAQHVWQV